MACDIAKGRVEQCKDQVGGLKAVYFINYQIARAYLISNFGWTITDGGAA